MFLLTSDLWGGGPSSLSSDEASTDWLEGPLLMMTQEEFMDVLAMKRQGMSFKEIGDELGYHPARISKWVRGGGPPPARN